MLHGFGETPLMGSRGNIFAAHLSVTPMSTIPGGTMTGLSLYNPVPAAGSRGVTAFLLAACLVVTTAPTVITSAGLAIGGPSTAPTGTSGVGHSANCKTGGSPPVCQAFGQAGYSVPISTFMALWQVHTGALTVDTLTGSSLIHLGGAVEIDLGGYVGIQAEQLATTGVFDYSLMWLEIPND